MKRAELEFQIAQLRQDKIIYGVESVATSLAGILLFLAIQFLGQSLPLSSGIIILFLLLCFVVPLAYWVFMVIGNTLRLMKIRQLERVLEEV